MTRAEGIALTIEKVHRLRAAADRLERRPTMDPAWIEDIRVMADQLEAFANKLLARIEPDGRPA